MAAALKKQKKITVCGLPILFQKKERVRICVYTMSDGRVGMGRSSGVEWSMSEAFLPRPYLESGSEARSTVFLL